MKQFYWSLAKLLISLTLFFNIERIDLTQNHSNNLIDIHSFIYVLGIVAVLTIIFIPAQSRWSLPTLVLFWVAIFLVFKLVFINQRPFMGGLYTYLSLTEGTLLLLLVVQSHNLAAALHDLRKMAEYVALADAGIDLPQLDEAEAKIRREMTRSRYYHRALSVIVIKPDQTSLARAVPNLMKEIEKGVAERYMANKLAEVVGEQLRVVDTVLEDRENGGFVILCPEVDAFETLLLAERIRQTATDYLGLTVHCGTASFSDEIITFEALVSEAYRKLKPVKAAAEHSVSTPSELSQAMGN